MSEAKKRKIHTPDSKAKVGLETLRGVKTINTTAALARNSSATVEEWVSR